MPSLDDWEKDWRENPQRSVQPNLLRWISACRWLLSHNRIEIPTLYLGMLENSGIEEKEWVKWGSS